ncbi:MAG TPA: hypothetical protein GX702_06430 [Chloroflexi bacterium]|nr:hypothetical protein [Chloroflexota bacterium]
MAHPGPGFAAMHTTQDGLLVAALGVVLTVALSLFIDQSANRRIALEKQVRQRTAELRESEQHFRTLADSGQALIWTSGIDGMCDYFNRPWLEFTGRTMEQEIGEGGRRASIPMTWPNASISIPGHSADGNGSAWSIGCVGMMGSIVGCRMTAARDTIAPADLSAISAIAWISPSA